MHGFSRVFAVCTRKKLTYKGSLILLFYQQGNWSKRVTFLFLSTPAKPETGKQKHLKVKEKQRLLKKLFYFKGYLIDKCHQFLQFYWRKQWVLVSKTNSEWKLIPPLILLSMETYNNNNNNVFNSQSTSTFLMRIILSVIIYEIMC